MLHPLRLTVVVPWPVMAPSVIGSRESTHPSPSARANTPDFTDNVSLENPIIAPNEVPSDPVAERLRDVPPPIEEGATVIAISCTSGREKLALKYAVALWP